jgi:hypothetical protein
VWQSAFRERGAVVPKGWVAAYRLAPAPAHPLLPRRADGDAIPGMVWVSRTACSARWSAARRRWRIDIEGSDIRFSERGSPWSPALPSGVLASADAVRRGAGWRIIDRSLDRSVLPPDAMPVPVDRASMPAMVD